LTLLDDYFWKMGTAIVEVHFRGSARKATKSNR
jgi:hypothetical protein